VASFAEVDKMKIYTIPLVAAVLLVVSFGNPSFASEFIWDNISRENVDIKTVLVDRRDPCTIYIGTDCAILKTEDKGVSWRTILFVKGQNKTVNFMTFDPQDKNSLYAATGNGLFFSASQGSYWRRIFKGKNYLENECTILTILSSAIYLGTKDGLFISKDKGKRWQKSSGKLGNSWIFSIVYDKENAVIYLAAEDGIYKLSPASGSYERIFIKGRSEKEEILENDNDDKVQIQKDCSVRYVGIDYNRPAQLYIATNFGLYKSSDFGGSWDLMAEDGLLSKEIKFLLVSELSYPYVITKSGIFVYGKEKWEELSLRLPTEDIRFLAIDSQNNLYAATDKGLFKTMQSSTDLAGNPTEMSDLFKDEPSIEQMQLAAIRYVGVVDPQRIENHRRQARIKAILPEFSLDCENTISSYSNTNSTRFSIGPREWKMSFKWNLSDLIWSEQQRLIDSQVRLMVELRNDILDEVNKLFFERRRLKWEIFSGALDSKKRTEKELKLQELSASLDSLTGGLFSQYFRSKRKSD
jgi:hypothetical protein